MISVEVHSNNVLTVRNDTFANAVSDSVKHETVKFLFSDNWKNYQKTAVFSAEGVEPINIVLDGENELCVSENECYIPFEVLKGDRFMLSVFGVLDESLATSTQENIKVYTSGYALGDAPQDPTPDEYSQIVSIMTEAKEIAQSVRTDADNGLFKGEKGDKGEQGEKGLDGMGKKTEEGGEIFNDLENNTAAKNAHAEGKKTKANGNASHAEGNQTKATGSLGSHSEGYSSEASGESSHAEGQVTVASGACSHAEGSKTKAAGVESHAEGISTSAKGSYSHSEGYGSAALGAASHAEGGQTSAWGQYSHASGRVTNAYASYSFAAGNATRADYAGQTAVGRYNSKPSDDSVFTVGVGTSDSERKNAFNVYADGHAEVSAVGDSDNSVATKQYVDNELATFDFIKVVDALPTTALVNKIYLVPSQDPQEQNLFDEYIWTGDKWEYITTKPIEVDLTQYYQKSQVDAFVSDLQDSISKSWQSIYPVGSVYLAPDSTTDPSVLFGGTWERQTVKRTVANRIKIEGFEANAKHTTNISNLSEYKLLLSNYSVSVTAYSGVPNITDCSVSNVQSSQGYIDSFEIITYRGDATSFSTFWSITSDAECDDNGYYHWKRTE